MDGHTLLMFSLLQMLSVLPLAGYIFLDVVISVDSPYQY